METFICEHNTAVTDEMRKAICHMSDKFYAQAAKLSPNECVFEVFHTQLQTAANGRKKLKDLR